MSTPKTSVGFTFLRTGNFEPAHLFTVTPDIPATDALNSVSDLLGMLEGVILAAAIDEEPLRGNNARMAHYALESARAALDAVIDGLERADGSRIRARRAGDTRR